MYFHMRTCFLVDLKIYFLVDEDTFKYFAFRYSHIHVLRVREQGIYRLF